MAIKTAAKPATPTKKTTPVKPVKKPAAKAVPAKKTTPAKPATKKPPAKKATAPVKKATAPAKAALPVDVGGDLLTMTQVWLRHDEVFPSRDNLRGSLTDIDDLAASIASVGLLEPLIVTLEAVSTGMPISSGDPGYYLLVAGHRRHAAIGTLIGDGRWPADRRIPCVVGDQSELSAEDRTVQMLIENLQRVDLNPVEEALGYKRLVDAGWKQTRIATAVGRHQNRVSERMQLIRLPEQWRTAIATGELSLGLAASLTGLTPGATAILLKDQRLPDKNTIDNAIRQDRIATAIAATKAAAKDRGLIYAPNKGSWQMHGFVRELDTTPDKLAKVLLPPDVTGWEVTLETYTDPGLVTVWRRTTAPDTTSTEPAELSPYDLYKKECSRLRREHDAAVAAFKEREKAIEVEWARTVETKTVAAALMRFEVRVCGEAHEWAEDLGWKKPDVDDDDLIEAHLQEWYNQPANISAALARYLGDNLDAPESFRTLRTDYLKAAGVGERPVLVFPPPPGSEDEPDDGDQAYADVQNCEPDENAHLSDDIEGE